MSVMLTMKAQRRPVEIPADGMVPLSDLAGVFGTTRTARRWAATLGGYLREKRAGQWHVHRDARLPGGQQVLTFLKCGAEPERYAGQPLPPGHRKWMHADWQHYNNLLELRRRYNELRAKFPNVNKEELARLFEQEHGEWAHNRSPRSLSCKRKRLDIYFDRINPSSPNFDGGYDGRGRNGSQGDLYSAEALAFSHNRYLDPRRPSAVACNLETAKWARENGYTSNASDRMARKLEADGLEVLRDLHDCSDPAGKRNVPICFFGHPSFHRLIGHARNGRRSPIKAQMVRRMYPVYNVEQQADETQGGAPSYTAEDIIRIVRAGKLRVVTPAAANWLTRLANLFGYGRLGMALAVFRTAHQLARPKPVDVPHLQEAFGMVHVSDEVRKAIDAAADGELLRKVSQSQTG